MSSTDSLLAKLGPKVAKIPAGERKVSADLLCSEKTLAKVKRALSLRTVSGVKAMTRVTGSQTQSLDYDAMTPQDVAAALGFIKDPLAREVFCLARWPGYAERDVSETRVLVLRRVMDEGQRLADEAITAWLQVELAPSSRSRAEAEQRMARKWPSRLEMYPRMVDTALRYMDGSGLPDQPALAKMLKVSERRFRSTWRGPMDWIYGDLRALVETAERQFRSAIKSGH
jgi:hypothetical protein